MINLLTVNLSIHSVLALILAILAFIFMIFSKKIAEIMAEKRYEKCGLLSANDENLSPTDFEKELLRESEVFEKQKLKREKENYYNRQHLTFKLIALALVAVALVLILVFN